MSQYKIQKKINSAKYVDTKILEGWLKSAADLLRGSSEGLRYIITLLFYKRICDVYDDEIEEHRPISEIVAELNTIEFKRLRIEEKVKEILGKL